MAIETFMKFSQKDTTAFWNNRLKSTAAKGFLPGGGEIVPVGGQLQVRVSAFNAVTYDGMVVRDESSSDPFELVDDTVFYVVLDARYHTGGDPTLEFRVLTETEFDEYEEPLAKYLMVVAVLDIPNGATEVLPDYIDYTERTEIDQQSRHPLRGMVETLTELQALTEAPTRLRSGDSYLCVETRAVHVWNGTAFDREVQFDRAVWAQESLQQREILRRTHGSCVLTSAHAPPDPDNTTTGRGLKYSIGNDSVDGPSITFEGFFAIVNGMYVHVPHQSVSGFAARPATDNLEWDVVFLEVWPSLAEDHEPSGEYPGGLNDVRPETFWSEAGDVSRNTLASTADRAGFHPDSGESPEFRGFWFDDFGRRIVLKYRLVIASDVSSAGGVPGSLTHPFSGLVADNVDGNPLRWVTIFNDTLPDYVYQGEAGDSSITDFSYAIPLLCIRRYSTEAYAVGAFEHGLPDGTQQVFDVSPISRQESGRRLALMTEKAATATFSPSWFVSALFPSTPSGVLTPISAAGDVYGMTNSRIRVPKMTVSIAGQQCVVPDTNLTLPTAPETGARIDLVVLEMTLCRYPSSTDVLAAVEVTQVPIVVDQYGNVYHRKLALKVHDAVTETSETQAMYDAGYVTPESVVESNLSLDPGLWLRELSSDELLEGLYPGSYAMAIPIAFVPRKNSDDFDPETNPNGSGGTRPDGVSGTRIPSTDIVDLRHFIVGPGDLEYIRESTWAKLKAGMLRTRLCQHPTRSTVYGSMLLFQDAVSNTAGAVSGDADFPAGYDSLAVRHDANVIDGVKGHFSWADETQPFITTLVGALDAAQTHVGGKGVANRLVTVSAAGGGGIGLTLVTVNAPRGAVFVNEDNGGWKPMVRCFMFADADDFESVDDNTGDITALTITTAVSGSRNVTQFTFKMPNAWRSATKTRQLITYVTFHGQGPDPANNLDVNRGLSAPPVCLLECSQPDGAGDVLVAPPKAAFTGTFDGSGVVTFSLGTNKAVGFDFLMGNRTNHRLNPAIGVECQDLGLAGVLTVSGVSNRTDPSTIADNTVFQAAPDAYVSTNDDFDTILVKSDSSSVNGKAAALLCSVRPESGARHWVEAARGSQALRGNFVWAMYEGVIAATGELHVPASAFSADGTNHVSPQSFFASGIPDVDVFVWRDCSDGGYSGNNKWRLMPHQAAGADVWSMSAKVNRAYLSIVFDAGGNGYTLAAGDTIRVIARIHEPPVVDNFDGTTTWDTTSYMALSYLAVPYQGVSDEAESNSSVSPFFGTVLSVGDVEIHTTGRVPAILDIPVDTNDVLDYLPNRAALTNNPMDVARATWQASVSRLGYLDAVHHNSLCLAYALPVLNLAWYDADDPASLPSGYAAGLAKWAFGHLLAVNGGTCVRYPLNSLYPGLVTSSASPTPPAWGSTIQAITEDRFTSPSFETRQGVCSAASEAALPFASDTGLTLCLGASSDVLCHAAVLGDVTGLGDMIESTTSYVSPTAYADLAGLFSFTSSLVFRHNVDGYQGASEWSNLGVVSTTHYLLRGTRPEEAVRTEILMHVTTSITNRTSGTKLSDRAPGTAHDLFIPYGRPICR